MRDAKIPIAEYQMGDISSTIYPVNGGLEDWAYGGGWDSQGEDSTVKQCKPITYSLPDSFNQADVSNVRAAIYIVETDNSKMPSERFLGSRLAYKTKDGRIKINADSVKDRQHDGHINRNIRLALALIDLTLPTIEIVSSTTEGDSVDITWRVNGCYALNEARAIINGVAKSVLEGEGRCNYLGAQSIFKTRALKSDTVVFEAVADQAFAISVNPSDVSPKDFANKP